MHPPATIHTLQGKRYRWLNVPHPRETELQSLAATFHLHPTDLKDCLPPIQRPKLIHREKYIFAIFVFPLLNNYSGEIEQHEVDFFIGKDFVITIGSEQCIELKNFFEIIELKPELKSDLLARPANFVAQLIDELLDSCFPLLLQISTDIDALRASVLHGFSKATVHEILRIKNNIVGFRKAMQPHKSILDRILKILPQLLTLTKKELPAFERLIDHTKEIWGHLEIYQSAIDAVEDTHATLLSFRLNTSMKTLTVFSIVILSLHLFTNLLIIPTRSQPLIGFPGDFWIILAFIISATLGAIHLFKWRKWL